MPVILTSLFIFVFVSLAQAEPAMDSKFLPKDTYLIPFSSEVTPNWVLDKTPKGGCRLILDVKAVPWLTCRERFLLAPQYGRMFRLDKPISDVAWLDDGFIFAGSRGKLAVIPVIQALERKPAQAVEPLRLKFLGLVRLEDMKLAIADGNSLYVYGRDPETGSTKIFIVRSGDKWSVAPLTATKEKVTAVAGDGKRTFVAIGRRVLQFIPAKTAGAEPQAQTIFVHPDSVITGLDYSLKLGLFYVTAEGVGFIGESYYFELLSSPHTQIRLAGSSLFIMLSQERGVLRLDGMNVFKELDAKSLVEEPAKPAELMDDAPATKP